jgi:hypothetical protein
MRLDETNGQDDTTQFDQTKQAQDKSSRILDVSILELDLYRMNCAQANFDKLCQNLCVDNQIDASTNLEKFWLCNC